MLARSFGDGPDPEPEPQLRPPQPGGVIEVAVTFVADRESLARLGYEVAAVIAAAVQDGIADGLSQGSSDVPKPASAD